jgi:MYXO-CTERM domain-containing protein
MVPTSGGVWDPSDALAALRLRYRVPGEDGLRESSLLVDSRPEPNASTQEVYLGHEAMAEHYSMYSVFRGLRDATRLAASSHACALTALERLDGKAASWQSDFADPDIEADRELIAQFQGNLREHGALPVSDAEFDSACVDLSDEPVYDEPDYVEPDYVEDDDEYYACQAGGSASGGAASLALVGIALVIARRRRETR